MIILENTKEYKDTKLTIPVGIGVVQTESTKNFYNTSDADATSADILMDKTAYGKYGKLTGTFDLDAEKAISYQDGYEIGKTDGYDSGYSIGYEGGYNAGETEQKSKLISITITENGSYTREDGYNEVVVDVPDLNGDYNEGYAAGKSAGYQDGYTEGLDDGIADGIADGRNQIIEEQSDANIKPNDVTKGKIGYGANNTKVVGTSEAITSIDVGASGIKFGYSSFSEIPSYYDFSNVTNMKQLFYQCNNLTSVALFDTSNVTSMYYTFNYCSNLTTVPLFDTSNVTNMYYMFYGCTNLTTVPLFDTSNVTDMYYMFYGCTNLTTVPLFDTSKVTNMNGMLANCSKLTSVPEFDLSGMNGSAYNCTQIFGTYDYVIDFGGFKDLGKAYQNANNTYRDVLLYSQSKLSYQSCMNVINKVYDLTLKPDYTNTPKIRFHATPYASLSADDIAIATAKGWSVQAG